MSTFGLIVVIVASVQSIATSQLLSSKLDGAWVLRHVESGGLDKTNTKLAKILYPFEFNITGGILHTKIWWNDDALLLVPSLGISTNLVDIRVRSTNALIKGIYTQVGDVIILCIEYDPDRPRPTKLTATFQGESRVLIMLAKAK